MKLQVFTSGNKEERNALLEALKNNEIIRKQRISFGTYDLEVEGYPKAHYAITTSPSGFVIAMGEGLKYIKEHSELQDMFVVGVLQDRARNARDIISLLEDGEIPNPHTLKTRAEEGNTLNPCKGER